jgi:hypothetical protein
VRINSCANILVANRGHFMEKSLLFQKGQAHAAHVISWHDFVGAQWLWRRRGSKHVRGGKAVQKELCP